LNHRGTEVTERKDTEGGEILEKRESLRYLCGDLRKPASQ